MSVALHSDGKTASGTKYTLTAQAFHWITAALMFAVLPIAWVMVSMPRTSASREPLFDLHRSIGLTILAIVIVRLLWRATHQAPPLHPLPRLEAAAAWLSHWLLYAVLVGMPVTGYLLTAAGGRGVKYFWLLELPGLPRNDALRQTAAWLHVAIGQWAVYVLIVLHIAATVWHVAVRRDGVLERMLPEQDGKADI